MVLPFASGAVMPKGNGINGGAWKRPEGSSWKGETVYAERFWHHVKHPKQPFTGINSEGLGKDSKLFYEQVAEFTASDLLVLKANRKGMRHISHFVLPKLLYSLHDRLSTK